MTDTISLSFTLNGQPVEVETPPKRSVLSLLRDHLGETGLKPGCSPQGVCGSCALIINGKVRLGCTLAAKSLEGKELQTLADRHDAEELARIFAAEQAVQCGYCIPGILTQTSLLLEHVPDPDPAMLTKALMLHTCRCTGWEGVRTAIQRAAAVRRGEQPAPTGVDPHLVQAALGRRAVVEDLVRPGMAHAAIVLVHETHGRLDAVDTAAAAAAEGVVAVLTATEIPGLRRQESRRPLMVAVGEELGCAGEIAALVVAGSPEAAQAAARLVELRLSRDEDPITTLEAAAALPERRHLALRHHLGSPSAEATVRVERTLETAAVDPAWIEPEAALAVPGEQPTVWSNAAEAGGVEQAVCRATGASSARVVLLPNGGAFGGRREPVVAALAAVAAQVLGRPVKLSLSLEEATALHGKRPASRVVVALRSRPDGSELCLEARVQLDGGGHPAGAEADAHAMLGALGGPYQLRSAKLEVEVLRTHNSPASALRAPGLPAATFALERAMDALAAELGLDPIALRRRNLGPQHHPLLDRACETVAPSGIALARLEPGPAPAARASLRIGATSVELCLPLGDDGSGLHRLAAAQLAGAAGLPASQVHTTCESGATALGEGDHAASVLVGLAEALGERLQAALALAGGELSRLAGTTLVEARQPGPPSPEVLVACRCELDADGRIASVHAVISAGRTHDALGTRRTLEGALHQGLGMAVSEGVVTDEQGFPDLRYRTLGVLKEKVSPPLRVELLDDPEAPWLGAELAAGVVLAAVGPAVAQALDPTCAELVALPMRETPAAHALGVRPVRAVPRPR